MTTNYPTSQDSFSRPTASSALTGHASLHDDISDAVESIESVVGITGGTSGALLFQKAVLTGTITGASGIMTMAITSDPHNLFDTASSNQVEANFNGFMLTRPTNQTDTNATVYFRDQDDYAQTFPYTPTANAYSTFATKWFGQLWIVRDTAHFDFFANGTQTNTITLECFAFLTY